MKELKERSVCGFKDHCETGFFTMKFHRLDDICKDVHMFRSVRFLNVSTYERFNVIPKRSFRGTTMRDSVIM